MDGLKNLILAFFKGIKKPVLNWLKLQHGAVMNDRKDNGKDVLLLAKEKKSI